MTQRTDKALRLEILDDGIAMVTFDVPGEPQNTLKDAFAGEFEALFRRIRDDDDIEGAVFISGKPDSFLAGADFDMLKGCKTAREAEALSRTGQQAFRALAALNIPVVAAIHGPCLGGGVELALACTSRICTDDPKTVLGMPEMMLGLLPGAGGTQRLPRLIGIANALDLLLTGRQVRGRKALKLGLVDDVVPRPILETAAVERAKLLAARQRAGKREGRRRRVALDAAGLQELALERTGPGRKLLFRQARKALSKKTRGNYPAGERIIDAVEVGFDKGIEAGFDAEARGFGELVVSDQARQLIGIYFAQNALKKDSGVDDPGVEPRPVRRVGILGAGLMGSGIAYVTTTRAGIPCRLKDKDDAGVLAGLKAVRKIHDKRVKRGSISRTEADRLYYQVTGSIDYRGFEQCDLVVEAVFENLALKHQVLRDIESLTGPETIFASNTSSIPISRLAEASSRPETVIGMHYFSPVEKMPLLEIITTGQTADWVTATCVALGKEQGKTVIVVRDGPGFYTTRILAAFMNEAARILTEGVPIEDIDEALKNWGFPVGPIILMDEVGIDVAEKVGKVMIDAFGQDMAPPPAMTRLVADNRKGRKNKKGFYTYGSGKKKVDRSVYRVLGIKPDRRMDPVTIAERCAWRFANEAVKCLGEGVLRCARDGDIGAIFGLGFPPFRGGPFRYIDDVGAENAVAQLEGHAATLGDRFRPAPLLAEMARDNRRFHP